MQTQTALLKVLEFKIFPSESLHSCSFSNESDTCRIGNLPLAIVADSRYASVSAQWHQVQKPVAQLTSLTGKLPTQVNFAAARKTRGATSHSHRQK